MKKAYIILLLTILMVCKEKVDKKTGQVSSQSNQKNQEIKAVGLFLLGKVESGSKLIRRGEVVSLENGLKTGKNSLIDVQIMGNKLNPVIRLHESTIFRMKAIPNDNGETLFKGFLEKGTVLVNMEKMNKDSRFVINTPTMAAEFRGTQVLISAEEDGTSVAKLTEGSVAIKMNNPVIDIISEKLPDESYSKQFNQEMQEVEVVMEIGQEVIISRADAEKVIKEKNLDEFVKSPEINQILKTGDEDTKQINDAIEAFKNKHPDHSVKEEDSKPQIRESIKLLGVKEKEKTKLIREFEEMKGISRDKIIQSDESTIKKEADAYLTEHRSEMVNRIELSLGKKSEGITLKNGKIINGVVFQLHDQLKVVTPEGEMVIPTSEVKSFSF